MQRKNTKTINQLSDCPHPGPVLRDPKTGATFKGDCGDRRNCVAARNRFRKEFESRLARLTLVPRRPLVLWTFTARTAEQDATYRSVEKGIDRGNPSDPRNWRILANGINQVETAVLRQLDRQNQTKYRGPICVKAESGSRLRLISVREVGTEGRAHIHTLSDIQFIDHDWITDRCLRNGLGFPEYERIHPAQLRGRHIPAHLVSYLSKFAPDDRPWPFPKNLRVYSAVHGRLSELDADHSFEKVRWSEFNQASSTDSDAPLVLVPSKPL